MKFSAKLMVIDSFKDGADVRDVYESLSWAIEIDGETVNYLSAGICYCNGYILHEDWCI